VDLDGDGDLDILSGSWPGELFFFRRGADGSFATPVELQDENGAYINIGGGIHETDDEILITGNAGFVEEQGKTFAVYHGKRIACDGNKEVAITGTASAVHACDWDADGDLDLLVGQSGGDVYLIPNLGSAKEWRFGRHQNLRAGPEPLHVEGDAGPFACDWDGDGDLDLLVGDGHGTVSLFVNGGTRAEPQLTAAQVLVPGTGWREQSPVAPEPGVRVKVCAADWNGDGKLDLLVGDRASLKPDLPEPTDEQKKAHDEARAELEELYERYGELRDKLDGRQRVRDEAERAKVREELGRLRARMDELRASLPPDEENHGWIWFFARR